MIYHYFRELSHHRVFRQPTDDIEVAVFPEIEDIIQKRWKSIKRESVLAAYLLDPSKSPDNFHGNDLDKAVDACVTLAVRVGLSDGVTEQAFYDAVMAWIRAKDGWSPEKWVEASSKAPLDWWGVKSADFAVLKDFATRVLSIPMSSAASERSWSDHAFIHSKRRNRLKPARVEKLAFLYGNVGNKMTTRPVHYRDDGLIANFSGSDSDSSSEFGEYDTPIPSSPLIRNMPGRSHHRDRSASRSLLSSAQAGMSTLSSRRRNSISRGQRHRDNSSARRSLFSPAQTMQVNSFESAQIPPTPHSMPATSNSTRLTPLRSRTKRAGDDYAEHPLTQSTTLGQVLSRADEIQLQYQNESQHTGYHPRAPGNRPDIDTARDCVEGSRLR